MPISTILTTPKIFDKKGFGIPLLEIYIPLRERGSDRIFAVGEFYENAVDLKAIIQRDRIMSWLIVGAVTLSMLAALSAIVRQGSITIEQQRSALEQRIGELTNLLTENERLRSRVRSASARATRSNEDYLQRLGADLHDGPAQLISLALLQTGDYAERRPTAAGTLNSRCSPDRHHTAKCTTGYPQHRRRLGGAGNRVCHLARRYSDGCQRHERLTGTTVDDRLGHAARTCPAGGQTVCLPYRSGRSQQRVSPRRRKRAAGDREAEH